MPYGFICGFPVASKSSELWGYIKGQQRFSGLQGDAIYAAAAKWGGGKRTELDNVCKAGYKPFCPRTGAQMFGCRVHSDRRKELIERSGGHLRPGWEPFDQFEQPAPVDSSVAGSVSVGDGGDEDGDTVCALGLSSFGPEVSAVACSGGGRTSVAADGADSAPAGGQADRVGRQAGALEHAPREDSSFSGDKGD